MRAMLDVNVEINKLPWFLIRVWSYVRCGSFTYPREPNGTAFAYFAVFWLACGTLGARYSRENYGGLREMVVVMCERCGLGLVASMSDEVPFVVVADMVVVKAQRSFGVTERGRLGLCLFHRDSSWDGGHAYSHLPCHFTSSHLTTQV